MTGPSGYRIDPSSGYAPLIYFTPDEERVVRLALRFCGFGASGAFSVFNEVPASDGGLESSMYYTPVMRALNLHRALAFDYQSGANKPRLVEPLLIDVFNGVTYLIARVKGTQEIKGYRFSRITSMPVVLPDTFEHDEAAVDVARAWRPEFSRSPTPMDVVVTTNENYADLLVRQYPGSLAANKKDGKVEVGLSFDNPRAALRFAVEGADRIRLQSPKSLKADLADWLKDVNRGKAPALEEMTFTGPPTNDVLGQTLQLLHAVYVAEDGLRISELAKRFSLDEDHVRLIMDRLVALEPMAGSTDGTGAFPAHVLKECDDWDDEANDDSTYRADFSDLPEGRRRALAVHVARPVRAEYRPARSLARLPRPGDPLGDREDRGRHQFLRPGRDGDERDDARRRLGRRRKSPADQDPLHRRDGRRGAHSLDRTARDQGPQWPHLRPGLLHDPRVMANLPRGPDQRRRRQVSTPPRSARRTRSSTGSPRSARRATRSSSSSMPGCAGSSSRCPTRSG